MSRIDWNSTVALAAYDDGYQEAWRDAAEDLMAKLRIKGVTDENWNGGDVVEVVDTWLQKLGVDTHVYVCERCNDRFASQAELDLHERHMGGDE